MNKKGFTLIELLAVIVILAIIALIATPTILGVIEKSRKGAAKSSALGYIDAVEKQIMINEMDDTVTKENGKITTKKNGKVEEITYKTYANGTIVYYNPTTGEKCSESEAISTTGTKNGCMKWYTFNDEEGTSSVNLILDHNTTATVDSWSLSATQLTNDTNNWHNAARLITSNEVAKITNNTSFDASKTEQSWFFFDSNNETQTATSQKVSEYAWLFDNTYGCINYGCNIENNNIYNNHNIWGYWTNSACIDKSSRAWFVTYEGSLYNNIYSNALSLAPHGVRPVISVSKSVIK